MKPEPEARRRIGRERKKKTMPVLAKFYGIVIRLLCVRSLGARLHAFYGDAELVINLRTLKIIQSDAPPRVRELVLVWARQHYRELQANAELVYRGQPPLAIAPLA